MQILVPALTIMSASSHWLKFGAAPNSAANSMTSIGQLAGVTTIQTAIISNLTFGTTVYLFVVVGTSTIISGAGVACTPANALATVSSPGSVRVSWMGFHQAMAYRVLYKASTDIETTVHTRTTPATSVILYGLAAGRTHTITVLWQNTTSQAWSTLDSVAVTLPNCVLGNFSKAQFKTANVVDDVFSVRAVNASSGSVASAAIAMSIFETDDNVEVAVPDFGTVGAKFLSVGDSIAVQKNDRVYIPFDASNGSVTFETADGNVNAVYAANSNVVTIGGVAYGDGDLFSFVDGQRARVKFV